MALSKAELKFLFQYNSCYCLSSADTALENERWQFQYNSCYCLSYISCSSSYHITISIQLLLLFILVWIFPCLRWHADFNTTLVIVYLNLDKYNCKTILFQYNSCYCLSIQCPFYLSGIRLFQYNSCYCLSLYPIDLLRIKYNFNTTLVIVYPTYFRHSLFSL